MLCSIRTFLAGLVVAVLFTGLAPDVHAQSRTLSIQNGEVYIDGRRVPAEQLPPSLDVSGMTVQYSFTGINHPVVELDGALYAIGDSLKAVPADRVQSRGSLVFFRDHSQGQQAASLGGVQEAVQSDQVRQQQMARQQYMEEVQRRSEELYNRLMREHQMEQQTRVLAQNIRQLPEGDERQRMLDSLRSTLNSIFDLKQENRRREIEQLNAQIEQLQANLDKREEMRTQMINQRMRELIGEPVTPNE